MWQRLGIKPGPHACMTQAAKLELSPGSGLSSSRLELVPEQTNLCLLWLRNGTGFSGRKLAPSSGTRPIFPFASAGCPQGPPQSGGGGVRRSFRIYTGFPPFSNISSPSFRANKHNYAHKKVDRFPDYLRKINVSLALTPAQFVCCFAMLADCFRLC